MSEFDEASEPIASGRTADVYPRGEGEVVKLLRPSVPPGLAAAERRNTAAALALGLPVAAVSDVIRRDGRVGLVFRRIRGHSMLEMVARDPDSGPPMAALLARVQRRIHDARLGDDVHRDAIREVPRQKDVLRARIEQTVGAKGGLTPAEGAALAELIDGLPSGDWLCHGDFHPGNVMMAEEGPVVIDWVDATRGNPLADVARTSLLLLEAAAGFGGEGLPPEAIEAFHGLYLQEYFGGDTAGGAEYEQWLPVVAAARLAEGMTDRREWLLQRVRERMKAG